MQICCELMVSSQVLNLVPVGRYRGIGGYISAGDQCRCFDRKSGDGHGILI